MVLKGTGFHPEPWFSKNFQKTSQETPDLWANPLVLWKISKNPYHWRLSYSDIFFSNLELGVLEVIPKSTNAPNTGSYLKPNRLENSWEVRWGEQPSSVEENKTMWTHLIQWSLDSYSKIQHYGEAGEGGKKGLQEADVVDDTYTASIVESRPLVQKLTALPELLQKQQEQKTNKKRLVHGRKNHHHLSLYSRKP